MPVTRNARPIHEIAQEIIRVWGPNIYYAAKPYLDAMRSLDKGADRYGQDRAADIVAYFLVNAKTWRGDDARRIKAELRGLL